MKRLIVSLAAGAGVLAGVSGCSFGQVTSITDVNSTGAYVNGSVAASDWENDQPTVFAFVAPDPKIPRSSTEQLAGNFDNDTDQIVFVCNGFTDTDDSRVKTTAMPIGSSVATDPNPDCRVNFGIDEFAPGTTYNVRLCAADSEMDEAACGAEVSFTTDP